MNRRDRMLAAAFLLGGIAALVGVVLAASQLCPAPTAGDPCLEADRNRLIVLGLAATTAACASSRRMSRPRAL